MKLAARLLALFAMLLAFAAFGQAQDAPAAAPVPAPPAQGAAPAAPQTAPTPPDSTALELIHYVKPEYPVGAYAEQMQDQIRLKIVVNEAGDVESAEVLSGDAAFHKAAVKAARQWKYKSFIRDGKPVKVYTNVNLDFVYYPAAVRDTPSDPATTKLVPCDSDALPASGGASVQPNLPPCAIATDSSHPDRVRIRQSAAQGTLVHRVMPSYPPDAKASRVQGSVVLHAVIGKDGGVEELTPISGPPQLFKSAIGTVRQWRYKPFELNGKPVEVDTEITVNYSLTYH